MQATRERILNILKERGEATVKELSTTLDLTTVTIRHHLDTLRREKLVDAPTVRHRKAPGRPQHVYTLTEEASDFFPKRYERLIDLLLDEMARRLPSGKVEEMMVCIGKRMADDIVIPEDASLAQRVRLAMEFLEERGYMPLWEKTPGGEYLIHIANCPYESVAQRHSEVCEIDRTLLSELLSPDLAELHRVSDSPNHCTYVVRRHREDMV